MSNIDGPHYYGEENKEIIEKISQWKAQRQQAYDTFIRPYDEEIVKLHGYLRPTYVVSRKIEEINQMLQQQQKP
jgi:predicted GNAT superfamily acetyltransferase